MSERRFPPPLCLWTKDKGLTFLAEGQYYRKQEQCRPILKLWGLIFLKSPVIVFDKSIWEAFREQIRDAPWPTFPSPPPLSPTPPPQVLDQSFNQAYLKVGRRNLQPTLPQPLPSRPHAATALPLLRCLALRLSLLYSYLPSLSLSLCIPSKVKWWGSAANGHGSALMLRPHNGCRVKRRLKLLTSHDCSV